MKEIDVLLVDDDEAYLDFMTALLRSSHLVVEAASSGEEALEILKRYRPEVVVSDVAMPGMSGYELCRRMREGGEFEIPFLFSSAHDELPERIVGLRVGADDYVAKSADVEELLLKVRQQIQSHRRLRFMTEMAERRKTPGLMSGSLRPIFVPELLQVIGYLRLPEVCVSIETACRRRGEVFLREGDVVHAQLGKSVGAKALTRILGWTEGTFRVEPRAWTGEPTLDEPLERALMDGLVALDHYNAIHAKVRERGSRFTVTPSLGLFACRFGEPRTRVLALVAEHQDLVEILDESPLTDLETIRSVAELLEAGVIAPVEVRAPLPELLLALA